MRGGETEVFEGKSLSGLLQDIYDISRDKRREIGDLITEMSKHVNSANDVINLAPVIQGYLEVSVKNDEQLTKMATIAQRIIVADVSKGSTGDPSDLLTESEKEVLLKTAVENMKETAEDLEDQLDSISKAKPANAKTHN